MGKNNDAEMILQLVPAPVIVLGYSLAPLIYMALYFQGQGGADRLQSIYLRKARQNLIGTFSVRTSSSSLD